MAAFAGSNSLKSLAVRIFLPLLVAVGGVTVLMFYLLDLLSTGTNAEDRRRTTEVVSMAFMASAETLEHAVADNAYWDDAARLTYAKNIDFAVADSYWGGPSSIGLNYDAALVLDGQGKQRLGFVHGKIETPDIEQYFSGGLRKLLKKLPQNNQVFGSTSSVLPTPEGPAIVAVGNIVPTTADMDLGTTEPVFLVFVKYLTPALVADIGRKFVVKDFALLSPNKLRNLNAGEHYFTVNSAFGDPVAYVTWSDRRPGDVTLRGILPSAVLTWLLLVSIMVLLGHTLWRQLRQIRRSEVRALHDSQHDALTGLPNRKALRAAIISSREQVCVLYLDIDGFKEVNDTYNHQIGDRLLRIVAKGLRDLVGKNIMVSRIGGDEFVILLVGEDAISHAETIAKKVAAFLQNPFDIDGCIASIGSSIGIAVQDGPKTDADELLRRADVAMYRAKANGNNSHCFFDLSIDNERIEIQSIVEELQQILAEGRLDVYYQPIVDANRQEITAVEALARWPLTSSRKIGPDRFVAIAESSGLINRLGETVLKRACQDAKNWGDIRVSVNISPVQLRDANFTQKALDAIDGSGIDRNRVQLEVTEGILIDNTCQLKAVFGQLKSAGVTMALDDFGTGYSSIAYLRELQFDRIKIDRSLVSSVLTCDAARSMVQATCLIAQGIKAHVTAEGIENEDVTVLLTLAGCTEFQGYHFGKPQSADAIMLNYFSEAKRQKIA